MLCIAGYLKLFLMFVFCLGNELCAVRLFKVESLLPATQRFVDISGEVVVQDSLLFVYFED